MLYSSEKRQALPDAIKSLIPERQCELKVTTAGAGKVGGHGKTSQKYHPSKS